MTFGKWNTSGELTWATGEILTASNLNTSVEGTIPPIGSVLFWAKDYSGSIPTIPSGWLECDGSVVSDADSPLNGVTLPDINGNDYFLSGSNASGATGGVSAHNHVIPYSGVSYPQAGANNFYPSPTNTVSHLPPYYTVVTIIRIK